MKILSADILKENLIEIYKNFIKIYKKEYSTEIFKNDELDEKLPEN